MAASTPSRPTLCIVPSNDVLLLAEDLQGLGGKDIALAKSTLINLFDLKINATGAADEVARWLADGCSATTLAPGCDLELASTFIQHVIARMDTSLDLSLSWAHVSPTKAINCIGTALPPMVGLRGAPAVRLSHLGDLESILQVVFSNIGQSTDTILTLGVFNPADSTLASLNLIFCNGRDSKFKLMELMAEVAELHAKRYAGEHMLRSSRLGLLNQFTAPLLAGNARLFIPRGSCPPELENRIEVIKAVCTRVQVPATDLKWMDTQQYLEAVKSRQQQQAQAQAQAQQTRAETQTPAAAGGHQYSTGSLSGEASIERRRQQRARVSSSLQRAAALGAARLSSSSSAKFKLEANKEERRNVISENGETSANLPSSQQANHSNEVYKENQHQEQNIQHINGHLEEVSGSSSKPEARLSGAAVKPQQEQPPLVHRSVLPVTKGIAELTSPSGAVCYGSPSPFPNKRPTSSSNKGAGHDGSGVGESWAGSKTGNKKETGSYAAAFRASHPKGTPASLSFGKDGFGKEESHRRGPQERVPATAALQRRLWASSTAMPPVTDVFQSESFEFGVDEKNDDTFDHQEDATEDINEAVNIENAAELHFDLSEQAASVASSVARARGHFTASLYSSQQQEAKFQERYQEAPAAHSGYVDEVNLVAEHIDSEKDERRGEELLEINNDDTNHAYEHTYPHYSESNNTAPNYSISEAVASATGASAAAELAAELEKERRVNSVLLKQLQEAQERAAMATAAAASVPTMEHLDSGDFNGVLAALQHERLRNSELGQQAQQAAEAKLSLEVELASAQQENAITRARCRALEREFPLAHVFAQCEAAVKSTEEKAQRLQKENSELTHAVAEAEISSLIKPVLDRETNSSDTSAVIATLHKKLKTAHCQIRKLKNEMAAQQAKARATESAVRSAEINRRTAEDAMRRNAALQEALTAAETRLEYQCLAAAEALAAAEELQRKRDEFVAALEAEQERNEQLFDLAKSFKLRAQVGAAYARTDSAARSFLISSDTPAPVTSRACI